MLLFNKYRAYWSYCHYQHACFLFPPSPTPQAFLFLVLWAFDFFLFSLSHSYSFPGTVITAVITLFLFSHSASPPDKIRFPFLRPQRAPIPISAQSIQCTLTLLILSLSLISFITSFSGIFFSPNSTFSPCHSLISTICYFLSELMHCQRLINNFTVTLLSLCLSVSPPVKSVFPLQLLSSVYRLTMSHTFILFIIKST